MILVHSRARSVSGSQIFLDSLLRRLLNQEFPVCQLFLHGFSASYSRVCHELALKKHGFSRAAQGPRLMRALAPEGCFEWVPDVIYETRCRQIWFQPFNRESLEFE